MVDYQDRTAYAKRIASVYPEVSALFSPEQILNTSKQLSLAATPAQLIDYLARQQISSLELPPDQAALCANMSRALMQQDSLTGFDKPYYKELNLALIQSAQASGASGAEQAFYLASDVSNLRGLNLALSGSDIELAGEQAITRAGREMTDGVLKLMSHVFQTEVEKMVEQRKQAGFPAHATFYRDGGDELSACITGMGAEDMQVIQERIHTRVNLLIEETGLDDILHPKYPFLGERAGAGLSCGFVPITPAVTLEQLGKAADILIEEHKAQKNVSFATRAPRSKLMPEAIEHAANALRGYAVTEGITLGERTTSPPFPLNQEVLPSADQSPADFVWPNLRRKMQVDDAVAKLHMAPEAASLLEGLHSTYEANDPVTGYQRHSPFGVISEGLEYLRAHPGDKMHVLIFEMQNFAGMNEKLGHGGCDQVFGDLARKVVVPHENALYFRPEGRGDRLYVFVHGADNRELTDTVETILAASDAYVAVKGLHDLPNPRYPDASHNGVRFVVGATQIAPHLYKSPFEIFDALDGQIRHNKGEHACFDGIKALGVAESRVPFRAQTSADRALKVLQRFPDIGNMLDQKNRGR